MYSRTELKIFKAKTEHIPGIIKLYESVHINEENFHVKVDKNHSENFSKTGGMFQKLTEEKLNEMINSNEYYTISVLINNEIIGYASYLVRGSSIYNSWNIIPNIEIPKNQYTKYIDLIHMGKVGYGIDIIVLPNYQKNKIYNRMTSFAYKELKKKGCTHIFFEIYSIIHKSAKYDNPNNEICLKKFGSHLIGYRFKKLAVGKYSSRIKAYVHLLSLPGSATENHQ